MCIDDKTEQIETNRTLETTQHQYHVGIQSRFSFSALNIVEIDMIFISIY